MLSSTIFSQLSFLCSIKKSHFRLGFIDQHVYQHQIKCDWRGRYGTQYYKFNHIYNKIIDCNWFMSDCRCFNVWIKKPQTVWFDSDGSILYWPMTIKFRTHKQSSNKITITAVCSQVLASLIGISLATQ